MKIQTSIRAPKNMTKEYLNNLFKDVAEFIATLPQYEEGERVFFGKEDMRGAFNISVYRADGCGMAHFHFADTSKELIAFCEGIRTAQRGW